MIQEWKTYLHSKNLYFGNLNSTDMDLPFKLAMIILEKQISNHIPSVKGMIWYNNSINKNASIKDIDKALTLLKNSSDYDMPEAQNPSLNDLPPTVPFISQDAANQDEWNPKTHQNNGKWQNSLSKNIQNKQLPKEEQTILLLKELDDLVNLIDQM